MIDNRDGDPFYGIDLAAWLKIFAQDAGKRLTNHDLCHIIMESSVLSKSRP